MRNRAYLIIVVAAIVMLATLLGGLALRKRARESSQLPAPPANSQKERR
jgi:hypothetical protein